MFIYDITSIDTDAVAVVQLLITVWRGWALVKTNAYCLVKESLGRLFLNPHYMAQLITVYRMNSRPKDIAELQITSFTKHAVDTRVQLISGSLVWLIVYNRKCQVPLVIVLGRLFTL